MIVSLSRRIRLVSVLALVALALTAACGGGDDKTGKTQGGSRTDSQLDASEQIQLQTSLDTTYYSVEGLTTEAVFAYIERNGPTDGEGKRGSGLTSVVWGYEWQGGPESGECTIGSMTIKADMVVTLPRHTNAAALPPDVRQNWESYAQSVATHEQTHVDIYKDGAQEIKRFMGEIGAQPSCDKLESEIKRVWSEQQNKINARQASFHSAEFARLAAQREPISKKIDANRNDVSSLQRQIDAQGRKLRDLNDEIDELAREIAAIDDQVKQINASTTLSPQDKQAQLVVLLQQRNALQGRHNEAVDEHNQALDDRDKLVAQRDALIKETNELVDLFNWTR